MPLTIPLRTDLPSYDLQAVLDGATYTLQLDWNAVSSAWFLSVLDADGENTLIAGLKVVVGFPLAAYRTGRKPPGAFVAIDSSGAGTDPVASVSVVDGLPVFTTDLGGRVVLTYWSAAELGLV